MPEDTSATAPGLPDTFEVRSPLPSFGMVLLWSASQPHLIGQMGFLPPFDSLYLGRGDVEMEKFLFLAMHRPGQPLARDPREDMLTGDSISRRQLWLRALALFVEMTKVGQCVTLVNGVKCEDATLRPGDTVWLKGEALLLCVRRQKNLPLPGGDGVLHAFGEADADGIVGESEAAWQLRADIAAAAAGEEHVLVNGESGTGKELVAAAIHRRSARAAGPFIDSNAAVATDTLLESKLFGNLAGYPNPGMAARKGLLPSAHGGTFFYDEIGDCPLEAQAQLLRVLENGSYAPIGESISRCIDIRVIGATHKDDSAFRDDFRARFKRRIRVPPLRERREDIPLIIRHLLRQRAARDEKVRKRFFVEGPAGKLEPRLSGRLVDYLVRHPLPRNVRELEEILIEAVDKSEGDTIGLPPGMGGGKDNTGVPAAAPARGEARAREITSGGGDGQEQKGERTDREDPSREQVVAALQQEKWNITRAARRLGVHRNTVYRLIEEYGIKKE